MAKKANSGKASIFKDPIKGHHLSTLVDKFDSDSIFDAAYMLGIPIPLWYKFTRDNVPKSSVGAQARMAAHLPVQRASVALLARYSLTYPDRVPQVKFPEATKLWELLKKTYPSSRPLDLALFLMRDRSASSRWLASDPNKRQQFDTRARRLGLLFKKFIERRNLPAWKQLIKEEMDIRQRDEIKKMLEVTSTTGKKSTEQKGFFEELAADPERMDVLMSADFTQEVSKRPYSHVMRYADLLELVDTTEDYKKLSHADIQYIFGLGISFIGLMMPTESEWKPHHMATMNAPIADPGLAIMVRYYLRNPREINDVRMPRVNPMEALAFIEQFDIPQLSKVNEKELALLMGASTSVPDKWDQYTGLSSTRSRIVNIMLNEIEAGRFEDWLAVVHTESELRGISNIFTLDSWPSYPE